MSVDRGYGLMDLTMETTPVSAAQDDRGANAPTRTTATRGATGGTLNQAALLLGVSPERVAADPASNVLGAALVLAKDARALAPAHRLPATLGGWAPAVSSLTGITTVAGSARLLRDLYTVLARGLSRSDDEGDSLTIAPQPAAAALLKAMTPRVGRINASTSGARAAQGADYPGAIWAPSPNMTDALRPASLPIQYLVIHDTEGGCAASLNWLLNPVSGGSAHFLVCRDGTVYQLVHIHDIAWHAGNWYVNEDSIGIEHEGFRDSGGYTSVEYAASAALVRWLDRVYGLTLRFDRTSMIGHENVPSATHTDPGPLWDWPGYMRLVRGGDAYDGGDPSVAMAASGEIVVRTCPSAACAVAGTANWGEQFAVVGAVSGWKEIDYDSARGWLDAASITAGSGTRLKALVAVRVRDEADVNGAVVGVIPAGQVYVSRLLDTSVDAAGWWFIAYNHRYGFVSSTFMGVQRTPPAAWPTPALTPTPVPAPPTYAPTPVPTYTPAPTWTTVPTHVPSPTLAAVTSAPTPLSTYASVPTPPMLPTATPSPSATATPSPSPSATETITPSPTAIPTVTPSPSPSTTATPTAAPTPTVGPTITPVVVVAPPVSRPVRTRPHLAPPRRKATVVVVAKAKPLRRTTPPRPTTPRPARMTAPRVVVVAIPARVRLKAVLRLRVRSNKGKALLLYRITLPGGVALRRRGTTDVHGNAVDSFTMPGDRWLHVVLLAKVHHVHGRLVMPRVPHSIGGTYSVIVTVGKTRIIRTGAFRVVLWSPFT